ncbi:LysE family translocator [Sneathiella chinensis]|uniref:Lysine transporter LysE n=1 Tax=Sneathiella chinensis TaxID=349750 RepID=A0ABQ5U1I2_9PROT|nr:LysE family transporter [Sneathiella chinensis]GLQ06030.1 lysine transporter LysE [Sneathiella chinensis]
MELIYLFLKGLGIGLAVAAPVGPVGVLCIRRAVSDGRLAAISSGLGAALADAFYGGVAAFGLTAVSAFLVEYQKVASAVGGVFLLWLAWRILRSGGEGGGTRLGSGIRSNWSAFMTTFALTMTNPATVLSFAAIFAGIGFVGTGGGGAGAILLVSGVFLGSTLWWLFLAFAATALQKRLGDRFSILVNATSAAIIGLFGVAALVSLLFQ